MFLHSGASLHGHEYSNRPLGAVTSSPQTATTNLRSPLLRSALAPAKTRVSQQADGPPAPALRQRPVSDYIPRKLLTPEPVVRFQEVEEEKEEKPAPIMQEDSFHSESELSEATTTFSADGPTTTRSSRRPRRRRRAPHKSTRYFLGYPTPKLLGKTKVIQKVLPRLLLQLQRVSEDGRSRPVLEAFPSSRIAGPVIAPRLAKRFPGIFGVKRHLGYDDIVLVRRDDDGSISETESDGDESLEKRNLLAVYSPLKHSEEAEIVLEDGSIWVARPLANGSHDFVHTDAQGNTTTARWARRSTATACATTAGPETCAAAATTTTSITPNPTQPRFTFSVINPMTRRHPVMATLTQSTLEIQETYTSVSSSYGRYPPHRITSRSLSQTIVSPMSWSTATPTSPSKRSSVGSTTESDDGTIALPTEIDPTRTVQPIDESTKMLISVTALWVALRSGWSSATHTTSTESTSSCPTRSRRHTWSRPNSEALGRLTPQHSESDTPQSSVPRPKRYSTPLPSMDKVPPIMAPPPSRTPTPVLGLSQPPRRATSTGAAYMQRRMQMQSSEVSEEDRGRKTGYGVTRPKRASVAVAGDVSGLANNPTRAVPLEAPIANATFDGIGDGISLDRGIVGEKEETGRKGVRSRLFRWIHKLGAR